MKFLVIPSIRQEQLDEFFRSWNDVGGWDYVVLVDDSPKKTLDPSASNRPVVHYSHSEILSELGEKSWIISKKDSACRCFGLWKAWSLGAQHIITLDDDVRPLAGCKNLFNDHVKNLVEYDLFQSSVQGLRPRGMPACSLFRNDVRASVGLWCGVPDLYAGDMLNGYPSNYVPPLGRRVVPYGEYLPICGMNFLMHRDIVPLVYFPLQGDGQLYRRFDDIWQGLILKKGLDLLNFTMVVGEPFINHLRASDPVKCAVAESPGRDVNDLIWTWFASLPHCPKTLPTEAAEYIADNLRLTGPNTYFKEMGRALKVWVSLFKE